MKPSRRQSALASLAQKRINQPATVAVNLQTLVRVYFLDGSSKVFQMTDISTVKDLLLALKFNLELIDISTHAIFRVMDTKIRRLELNEIIQDSLRDPTGSGSAVRLLFRSWINYKYGCFEWEAFQPSKRTKQPTTALWLAYMEAVFMSSMDKYYFTEEESIMLGCLKMQAESGDFSAEICTIENISERIANRFPNPIKEKIKTLNKAAVKELSTRVQIIYARLAGKSKSEAQINFLESLRMWCPFYGSTFFDLQCQYDDNPMDEANSPPVLPMSAAVGPLALFLVVTGNSKSTSTMMRHPYNRIVKWVCHADKHIFTYWIIKPSSSLEAVEEQQRKFNEEQELRGNSESAAFDVRPFCDCVYLVSPQVRELEYLIKSYVNTLKSTLTRSSSAPSLPGASGDLLPPYLNIQSMMMDENDEGELVMNGDASNQFKEEKEKASKRRSMLGSLLGFGGPSLDEGGDSPQPHRSSSRSNGSNNNKYFSSGSGLDLNTDSTISSTLSTSSSASTDDSPHKTRSLFRNMYGQNSQVLRKGKKSVNFKDSVDVKLKSDSNDSLSSVASEPVETPTIKFAASMTELQQVAEETAQELAEEAEEEESSIVSDKQEPKPANANGLRDWCPNDDLDSEKDDSTIESSATPPPPAPTAIAVPPSEQPIKKASTSVDAFRRASNAIFGSFKTSKPSVSDMNSSSTDSMENIKDEQHNQSDTKELESNFDCNQELK